jgi:hypothetical protein
MKGCGVVVVALWLGCGNVQSDSDGGTGSDAAEPEDAASPDASEASPVDAALEDAAFVPATCAAIPVCAVAGTIATKEEIAAVGQSCPTWGQSIVDKDRPRSPTLVVTESTSVCPGDFALPDDCDGGGCRSDITLTVDTQLAGVSPVATCDGVQLAAGARFRLRFNLDPPFIGEVFVRAHVHFERPCGSDCVEGERRCEVNDTCHPDAEVCFACGFGNLAECACRDADNDDLPDCTDCSFIDPDSSQKFLGECQDGFCETIDLPPECS